MQFEAELGSEALSRTNSSNCVSSRSFAMIGQCASLVASSECVKLGYKLRKACQGKEEPGFPSGQQRPGRIFSGRALAGPGTISIAA